MKKIFIAACILGLLFAVCSCDTPDTNTSQVIKEMSIYGVKSNITVYADDTAEVINAAVLEGVSVYGDDTCEVKFKIISKQDSSEVTSLAEGEYSLRYYCENDAVEDVITSITVLPADTTPPVFEGIKDIVVIWAVPLHTEAELRLRTIPIKTYSSAWTLPRWILPNWENTRWFIPQPMPAETPQRKPRQLR